MEIDLRSTLFIPNKNNLGNKRLSFIMKTKNRICKLNPREQVNYDPSAHQSKNYQTNTQKISSQKHGFVESSKPFFLNEAKKGLKTC